jgi:hypothetical protein
MTPAKHTPLSSARLLGTSGLAAMLLLAPAMANAGEIASGELVEGAAAIDVTPDGFDAVTELLPGLLPSSLPVGDMGDSYGGLAGQCWLGGYEYAVRNLWIEMSVDDAQLIPQNGYLEIDMTATVQVNEPSDRFELYTELECIGDTCYGRVDPFQVHINTRVDLTIVENPDGSRGLDAHVGDIALDWSLSGTDIQFDDCFIGTVEDVLNFFGLSIFDLVLTLANGFIDDAVAGFVPEIEALLEDNFSQVSINQDLELAGVLAHLELYPGDIRIEPAGLRIRMDGMMGADGPATCVSDYDLGYATAVDSELPPIGSVGAGVDPNQHINVHLSDEFGNQALYSLWRAGLLCYTVDSELTGFPLDTNILSLLAGDAFKPLFPTSTPLYIQTVPKKAPTLVYNGTNDVGVDIDELGLEFYADLDHRKSMLTAIDLSTEAGVNLVLDAPTGNLGVEVEIDPASMLAVVTENEFVPDATADIETKFSSVFGSLLGPILGSALGDLGFALPAFSGFGLSALTVAPAGTSEDWLGIYAQLGPVAYEGAGCDTSAEGCSGGCGVTGAPGGRLALLGLLPLGLAIIRRRG